MQRANLPLSYPMTARRFLRSMACLMRRSINAVLLSKESRRRFRSVSVKRTALSRYGTGQNVLLITVDGLNYSRFENRCLRWQVLLSKIFRSRAI